MKALDREIVVADANGEPIGRLRLPEAMLDNLAACLLAGVGVGLEGALDENGRLLEVRFLGRADRGPP